jgi:hypothetical protein
MARTKDFSEARYGSIKRFQRGYPCLELKDFSEALLVPTSTYPLEFLKKFTSQKLTSSVCVCSILQIIMRVTSNIHTQTVANQV